MADKIASFEEYVKRESRKSEHVPAPKKEEVKQETMDIQIEDPFLFLSEEEREEYLLHRQKEHGQLPPFEEKRDSSDRGGEKPLPVPEKRAEEIKPPVKEMNYPMDDDEDDPYGDEDEEDDYGEDEGRNGARIEGAVKIASVITGLVILIFIALFLKTRVYDRFFVREPDEEVVTQIAIPEGFTEKEDTVVVTGASSLNLRSGPSTQSSKMTEVAEGTTLKRIAVSDDDSWAFVEYEGQYLYASMKYLAVQ